MNTQIRRARPMAAALLALLALAALTSACTDYDPRDEPPAVPSAVPPAVRTAAPTAAPSTGSTGSTQVVLNVATENAVTIDVVDSSGSLVGATSGTPADGASVEAYTLVVTNLAPTTLRLTWVGGPCDSANVLSIDATRHQLLLVQPECPGDAIATDRILDLAFSTPVRAADIDAFLQDGLDS